jgi:hypothetical protein
MKRNTTVNRKAVPASYHQASYQYDDSAPSSSDEWETSGFNTARSPAESLPSTTTEWKDSAWATQERLRQMRNRWDAPSAIQTPASTQLDTSSSARQPLSLPGSWIQDSSRPEVKIQVIPREPPILYSSAESLDIPVVAPPSPVPPSPSSSFASSHSFASTPPTQPPISPSPSPRPRKTKLKLATPTTGSPNRSNDQLTPPITPKKLNTSPTQRFNPRKPANLIRAAHGIRSAPENSVTSHDRLVAVSAPATEDNLGSLLGTLQIQGNVDQLQTRDVDSYPSSFAGSTSNLASASISHENISQPLNLPTEPTESYFEEGALSLKLSDASLLPPFSELSAPSPPIGSPGLTLPSPSPTAPSPDIDHAVSQPELKSPEINANGNASLTPSPPSHQMHAARKPRLRFVNTIPSNKTSTESDGPTQNDAATGTLPTSPRKYHPAFRNLSPQ